jgi:hypothetical protein
MKLSAGLALIAVFAASPEIRYFQYQRPLPDAGQRAGQSCLVLDPGILQHAAPELADLRLYHDGTETPFVLRTAAVAEGGEKNIPVLNVGQRDGQTVFDASLPDGPYSDLKLDVTGQNFIATVTVTGSQTQAGSAETTIGSYTIFDLTSQKLGRSTVLHLPVSDFRYLHFSIRGPLEPQSITGISVERLPATQPSYQAIAESAHFQQEGHTTVVEFSVPAHLAVDRIVFKVGALPAQFNREVSLSIESIAATKDGAANQLQRPVVSSGNLLRVHGMQNGQRIDEEHLAIDAPWVDSTLPQRWTITVENGDDAPLTLESARMEMLERSLCFEAVVNGSYTLYYGDPALTAPRYDYAAFFTPQANAAKFAAGPEQANPAYQPRPDARPFSEKHPVLLWTALLLVIALLALVALRTAKGIKAE